MTGSLILMLPVISLLLENQASGRPPWPADSPKFLKGQLLRPQVSHNSLLIFSVPCIFARLVVVAGSIHTFSQSLSPYNWRSATRLMRKHWLRRVEIDKSILRYNNVLNTLKVPYREL